MLPPKRSTAPPGSQRIMAYPIVQLFPRQGKKNMRKKKKTPVVCLSSLSSVLAVKDLHPMCVIAISEENDTQLFDNNYSIRGSRLPNATRITTQFSILKPILHLHSPSARTAQHHPNLKREDSACSPTTTVPCTVRV